VSWYTLKEVIIMDILHLVDRLEMIVSQGWRLPFTSNVMIQEDAFLDIIDQMRISIPEEVKHAKRVSAERERVLEQAQQEADRILALAQGQASSLADDHEIVKAAYVRAEEVIAQAYQSADKVKADADTYVMDALSDLEEQLLRLLTTVRNGIRQVQDSATAKEAEGQVAQVDGDSGG
jgi:vacuolar-type H+-ATPase subunit H